MEQSNILLKIADRPEESLEMLAVAETWESDKPVRETLAADIPLTIDHFRYFAGCIRAQEGGISEIVHDTVAYHFHEPLGVVGQIIPWNFPIFMAAWKIAPALAAGNCIGQSLLSKRCEHPCAGRVYRRHLAKRCAEHRQWGRLKG